jgi:tetratricopeptide (TPR) repeat protein
MAYEAALQIDPDYAAAIFRSGLVSELMGDWAEAHNAYQKYQELAPDDLAGLVALIRVSDKLALSNVAMLRQRLDSALDGAQSAAELLNLPASEIEVGPNVVINPGYEDQGSGVIASWAIGDYLNGQNGTTLQGAFAGGSDSLESVEGQYSARIDGLWRRPELSGFYGFISVPENPRGTYWIKVDSNQPYLVSGLYRMNNRSVTGQVDIGNSNTSLLSMALPGTNRAWSKFAGIACLRSKSPEWMQLGLQLITPGQIWFDQVKVQPLSSHGVPIDCNNMTGKIN